MDLLNQIVKIKNSNIYGKIVNISKDNLDTEIITVLSNSCGFYKYYETTKNNLLIIWEN